jgi:peroxiredoxin
MLAAALVIFGVSSACAQQTPPLEVGAVAPDFSLPGSTRYGLLRDPVRLSDFRGKTVILAFYFRSRTRG